MHFSVSSASTLDHSDMHFFLSWCDNLLNILPTFALVPLKSILCTEARLTLFLKNILTRGYFFTAF